MFQFPSFVHIDCVFFIRSLALSDVPKLNQHTVNIEINEIGAKIEMRWKITFNYK